MSDSDDIQAAEQLSDNDEAGGLFGSDSDDDGVESTSRKRHKLQDDELSLLEDDGKASQSHSDQDDDQDEGAHERIATVADIALGQHPGPLPTDGELYLLQFPAMVGIEPTIFTLDGFEPPTTDHHSSKQISTNFSSFQTSNNTIRWRTSPSDPKSIQSNSRINRWSDGSLTVQLGSNPGEQLELTAKPLAQPQVNPPKPTPTSMDIRQANGNRNTRLDAHTYLVAPHENTGVLRHTHHLTTSLAVVSTNQDDDALFNLQQGLAAAMKGKKGTAEGGLEVISISEDPENAKRRAELAEKEKAKMQRRSQIMQDRDTSRATNVLRRSGLKSGLNAGLTIGGLEDDESPNAGTPRKPTTRTRKPRRRNSEYSDDEDFHGRGRTREDEYDEDDGFLVGSDEEPEVEAASSDDEAEMATDGEEVEENETAAPAKSAVKEDALTASRAKRRRVIEDEDD